MKALRLENDFVTRAEALPSEYREAISREVTAIFAMSGLYLSRAHLAHVSFEAWVQLTPFPPKSRRETASFNSTYR